MNFKNLLALEWIKIQSRLCLIFLIIYLLISALFTIAVFTISGLPPIDGKYLIDLVTLNPFGRLITIFVSNLALIASLFYIMQTAGEYKHGMIRKNVMDGMSRNDVFNGKMILMFLSYIGWTILLLIVFVLCGLIKLPGHSAEFINSIQFTQIIKFVIYIFFYGAFSLFLVTLTRSSTISILILLGLAFIEPVAITVLRYYNITGIIPYLPFELASYIRTDDFVPAEKIADFLAYVLFFLGTSHWMTIKRDL